LQLRAFECVRFAENVTAQYCSLIGANDEMAGVVLGQCSGLVLGKSAHQLLGCLA